MLTLMMQESGAALVRAEDGHDANSNGAEIEDEEGGDNDEAEEDAWRNGDNYERLLELGHVLGDVKKDRWRSKAKVCI
jgi:hypothetical protein